MGLRILRLLVHPVTNKLTKEDNHLADPTFRQEYQSKVGSPNFAANQTRPDILL